VSNYPLLISYGTRVRTKAKGSIDILLGSYICFLILIFQGKIVTISVLNIKILFNQYDACFHIVTTEYPLERIYSKKLFHKEQPFIGV